MTELHKSIRLTNEIRDEIIYNVMKSWEGNNPPPERKFNEEQTAEALYNQFVPAKMQKELKEIYNKFGFSNEARYINLQDADSRTIKSFYFGEDENGTMYRMFCSKKGCGCFEYAEKDPKKNIFDLYEAENDAETEWDKQRSAFRHQVKSIIYSVNTTKQLAETWEEIVEFIPMEIWNPSKGIQLPAMLKEELNAQIK